MRKSYSFVGFISRPMPTIPLPSWTATAEPRHIDEARKPDLLYREVVSHRRDLLDYPLGWHKNSPNG